MWWWWWRWRWYGLRYTTTTHLFLLSSSTSSTSCPPPYSPMEGTRTALTARWKAHVLLYSPMEGTRSVLLPDGRHTFCPTVKYMRKKKQMK